MSTEFEWKLVSSIEKVYPDREPQGITLPAKFLTGLKGETISFQLAYRWNGLYKERMAVTAEIPTGTQAQAAPGPGAAETGPEALPTVRIRCVKLVPCEYPCHTDGRVDDDYDRTTPGLYPDCLIDVPVSGIPMISGQWRSVWIDLEIPENAAAGEGILALKVVHLPAPDISAKSPEELVRLELPFEILDAKLPQLPIVHTEWFHCDCLADYYHVGVFSEEHWKIIENFIRTAVKRHYNMILTPVFTPPLDTAFGGERTTVQLVDVTVEKDGYRFDFTKLDRWVSMALNCGMRYFEISHLFSQWGAVCAPKIMGKRNGETVQLFGWDTDAAGETYRKFLHQFLTELRKFLSDREILDNTYFHISDEPSMSQIDTYRAALDGVKDVLGDCKRFDALSDFDFYSSGLVPIPVCASDHIAPFLKNRPEHLWTYYCTGQWNGVSNRFIAMPGYRTRVLGAQLYKENIEGFLQWGYNFYNSDLSLFPLDPYTNTDADGTYPSGDPFVVYPGKGGKPVESLRLMVLDEGWSDLCAMKLLEEMTDRETVLKLLDGIEIGIDRYPKSVAGVEEIRKRVNDRIREELKRR